MSAGLNESLVREVAPPPVRVPAASTVRFALLVGAVVATSIFTIFNIYLALPDQGEFLNRQYESCTGPLAADPAWQAGSAQTQDDYDRVSSLLGDWRTCMRPVFARQVAAVGAGLALLFGLAFLAYLAHPWWLIRRRRLRRLTEQNAANLVGYLDELRRDMGLSRAPDWRLAPHSRSAGGQAFGLPWHRYVQLDAGLVLRYATNRPAMRAVVRHELAHLKNRDVDKTYLTIAIWRAFVIVSVLPYVVLLLHPHVFRTPLRWRWRDSVFATDPPRSAFLLGSLAALTVLVYLTRNAVLRVRELHADAVAAAHDGPDSALPTVLGQLRAPGSRRWSWWTRWGTHPYPAQRIAIVRDPGLLLTAGLWELAGAGLAAGALCANLMPLLGLFVGIDPILGIGIIGLVAGPPMAAMLAIAIWRATAAGQRPSVRGWLHCPLALVVGFAAGSLLSLRPVTQFAVAGDRPDLLSWTISILVLAAGTLLLAVWITSAADAVLSAPEPRAWAMPAVVVAAAIAGATAFAVWLPHTQSTFGFAPVAGAPPALGADIDGYVWLAGWTGAKIEPMVRLTYHPLTLLALTALWVVPVLAGLRRPRPVSTAPSIDSDRVPLQRAVVPALIGTACVAALGTVLPFLAKAALPEDVRENPDPDASGAPFCLVLDNTVLWLGALAVAVVMAVVAARGGRHGAALVAYAGSLTAFLSTVVCLYITVPIECYTNVWHDDPAPTKCMTVREVGVMSFVMHETVVKGVVLSVPFVLVAAVAGALYRRNRQPLGATAAAPTRIGFILTVACVVAAVGGFGWLTWAILPQVYETWLFATFR